MISALQKSAEMLNNSPNVIEQSMAETSYRILVLVLVLLPTQLPPKTDNIQGW